MIFVECSKNILKFFFPFLHFSVFVIIGTSLLKWSYCLVYRVSKGRCVGLNTPLPVHFDHVCTSQSLRLFLYLLLLIWYLIKEINSFFLSFFLSFQQTVNVLLFLNCFTQKFVLLYLIWPFFGILRKSFLSSLNWFCFSLSLFNVLSNNSV